MGNTEMLVKEALFLIRQFASEENMMKTAHKLEQETGFYFDMSYFEHLVLKGDWKKAEKYLSGFTGINDNKYSHKIYFELRKHKYLEALDKHEAAKALNILVKDLKVFASTNPELYRDLTDLLTMDDFRSHPSLSSVGDVTASRRQMMDEIKDFIKANPQFNGKLEFPQIEKSRLRRLINQSLNWQHALCQNPLPEPHIETLFTDHRCPNPSSFPIPLPLQTMPATVSPPHPGNLVFRCLNPSSFPVPLPLQSTPATLSPLPGKLVLRVPESCVSVATANIGNSFQAELNASAPAAHPRTSTGQAATLEGIKDSGSASTIRSSLSVEQTNSPPSIASQSYIFRSNLPDDFPNAVERSMEMSSSPMSMEFHPLQDSFLLVGNRNGEVELLDIRSEVRLFWNAFSIWNRENIPHLFLKDLDKDSDISVNRVSWNPDGTIFGVAYSKHIVQLYSYHAIINCTKQQEIGAHWGGVNDLTFSSPYGQLFVITCGDDKLIQVWDAITGSKMLTFEGHGAPVYSLCSHSKGNIDYFFSTSRNGEIRAWSFDSSEPKVKFTAPGNCCMRMAYSADRKRIFSCGTNLEGESYIVEWDHDEGHVTRTYNGLCKSSAGIVHFSTSRNRFLVAGDEHLIKIWDMDSSEVLAAVDAGGDLLARPQMCFNRKNTLLAVFAAHNKIKILASDVGRQSLLQKVSIDSTPTARVEVEEVIEESMRTPVPFQPSNQIIEVTRCRSLTLTSEVKTNKISRLTYTSAGNAVLALGEDGIHLLWRWQANGSTNNEKQASTNYPPRLWLPASGLLMMNDISDDAFRVVSPCLALSKNDSYVVSSSGKTVSLFNTVTFKKMRSCIIAPPAATCIAFYPPDNNIIAVGMDDFTIFIYNVRTGEVKNRLTGHLKRISDLAFSTTLKVLVSSGRDNQLFLWGSEKWERKNNTFLQVSSGWMPSEASETYVQFYNDDIHFLAIHETQLAKYEAIKLQRVNQWIIGNFCTRILHATLSRDNQFVYAVMKNGIVLIIAGLDLIPIFEIDPYVYIPSGVNSSEVRPLLVSAHPNNPYQIALGLSSGVVVIIEPVKDGEWVVQPPANNGTLSNRPICV